MPLPSPLRGDDGCRTTFHGFRSPLRGSLHPWLQTCAPLGRQWHAKQHAQAIANALGGETWQSGGDIWLVMLRRSDGKIVVLSDDAVSLYANEEAFERGDALQCIELTAGAFEATRG